MGEWEKPADTPGAEPVGVRARASASLADQSEYSCVVDQQIFDYVIVGAGSAGCVLANRLSSSGRNSVLLLESGPRDTNRWIRIPIGYAKLFAEP